MPPKRNRITKIAKASDKVTELAAIKGQAQTFFTGIVDFYDPAKNTVAFLGEEFHGPVAFALHGFKAPAFWLAFAGFALATFMYLLKPELPGKVAHALKLPIRVLENKYGMDTLWINGFAGGGVALGKQTRILDSRVIDGAAVNGSASLVDFTARLVRRVQSGYHNHYAFAKILGLIVILALLIRSWH